MFLLEIVKIVAARNDDLFVTSVWTLMVTIDQDFHEFKDINNLACINFYKTVSFKPKF